MKDFWYYEYIVKIFDYDDNKEESRAGILYANSFVSAMQELDDYYANELVEVQMLKAITDGVFEFQYVMDDTDFDFTINRKM